MQNILQFYSCSCSEALLLYTCVQVTVLSSHQPLTNPKHTCVLFLMYLLHSVLLVDSRVPAAQQLKRT